MHDLGHSSREHSMSLGNEYTGMTGESPLQEILASVGAGEAPAHEFASHEFATHEMGAHELGQHELNAHEMNAHEFQAHEFAMEGEQEFHNEALHEGEIYEAPAHEAEAWEVGEGEIAPEIAGNAGEMNEQEVFELTSELLAVSNEAELDQFLGRLVRRVARSAGRFIRSPAGRLVGGILRQIARRALPIAGAALGGLVGGPAGSMLGGRLAAMAGRTMGLELGEMSGPQADMAAARQFVRLASAIVRRAEAGQGPPTVAVRRAFIQSARRFAPGLVSPQMPRLRLTPVQPGRRGTWVRRGRTITLFGV